MPRISHDPGLWGTGDHRGGTGLHAAVRRVTRRKFTPEEKVSVVLWELLKQLIAELPLEMLSLKWWSPPSSIEATVHENEPGGEGFSDRARALVATSVEAGAGPTGADPVHQSWRSNTT